MIFGVCLIASSPYRYRPNPVASGALVSLFGLSLVGCLVIAATTAASRGRWRWLSFTVPVCAACALEIVGYAARLGSWSDPWDVRLFAVSTGCLTVAPAFVSAGIYTTISKTVPVIGAKHSLVNPAHYTKLLLADLLGFALQVIGLIVAFSDASTSAGLGPNVATGSGLVAAGLAAQLLSLSAFIVLFSATLARASLAARDIGLTAFHVHGIERRGSEGRGGGAGGGKGPVPLSLRLKAFMAVSAVSLVCLLARNLYAIMAASGGIGGPVAGDEALFVGLDGLMVAQAVVGIVIVHPAWFLEERTPKSSDTVFSRIIRWQQQQQRLSWESLPDTGER
ncbi:hypothetical protein SLS62_002709 [Diatrype stigma]|uniref:Uncharacterized protein n=1 Tax=Diatrype stigma TaxID=117547 RepID=A0AAN9V604_9PEZI